MSKLLTKSEAAKFLGISITTFDRLRKAGKIPVVNIGRGVKVRNEDIERIASEGVKRDE